MNLDIEWCHHTFNAWWGCAKDCEACMNCYAKAHSPRFFLSGINAPRYRALEKHWLLPLNWNAAAQKVGKRARVFCASMADIFEDHSGVTANRERLWRMIESTPWLDWLLLTKRPENIGSMVPWTGSWPRNIWLGASAENQKRANERIPVLLSHPAEVHFVSAEPLLSALDLRPYMTGTASLDWVITVGESGASARPTQEEWIRDVRDQCCDHGVNFFFKQWGRFAPDLDGRLMRLRSDKEAGRTLDGREWNEIPGGRLPNAR